MKWYHRKNSPKWAVFLSVSREKQTLSILKTLNHTMFILIANIFFSLICDHG